MVAWGTGFKGSCHVLYVLNRTNILECDVKLVQTFAILTNRALLLDWTIETNVLNGLMPCPIHQVLEVHHISNISLSQELLLDRTLRRADVWQQADMLELHKKKVKVFSSALMEKSGRLSNWGDLLLCRNLSYYLSGVPLVILPAWRWMPELIANQHLSPPLTSVFDEHVRVDMSQPGTPYPFFQIAAPYFVRPAGHIQEWAKRISSSWPKDMKVVGIHVRAGIESDSQREVEHFFSPAELHPTWIHCAYSAMNHETTMFRRDSVKGLTEKVIFFLASDSMETKINMLRQIAKEEGKVVKAINEKVIFPLLSRRERNRLFDESLLEMKHQHQLESMDVNPVVLEFSSGTAVSFLAKEVDRYTCQSVQTAMLDMTILSFSDLLVVSHYSTFTAWPVASSNASAFYAVSRDGDCFPLDSKEPFSESGELFRGNADCYTDKFTYQNSWSRPRQVHSRSATP